MMMALNNVQTYMYTILLILLLHTSVVTGLGFDLDTPVSETLKPSSADDIRLLNDDLLLYPSSPNEDEYDSAGNEDDLLSRSDDFSGDDEIPVTTESENDFSFSTTDTEAAVVVGWDDTIITHSQHEDGRDIIMTTVPVTSHSSTPVRDLTTMKDSDIETTVKEIDTKTVSTIKSFLRLLTTLPILDSHVITSTINEMQSPQAVPTVTPAASTTVKTLSCEGDSKNCSPNPESGENSVLRADRRETSTQNFESTSILQNLGVTGDGMAFSIEPTPDWRVAKAMWGWSWNLHVFLFGGLFAFLSLYSLISVIRLQVRQLLSRGYFMALNFIMFILGTCRAVYLLMDAYNEQQTLPNYLSLLIYNLVFPCLTSAFSILFLALLQTTKMQLVSPKIQRLRVLVAVMLIHFSLSITADLLVGFFYTAHVLLLVCQILFIMLGLLLSVGYLYIFQRLYYSTVHRINEMRRMSLTKSRSGIGSVQKKFRPTSMGTAVKVTLITAIFGLIMTVFQVYGMIGVYHRFELRSVPEPWPWYIYQTAMRLCELAMAGTMSFIATQPFRYNKDGTKMHSCVTARSCYRIGKDACICSDRDFSDSNINIHIYSNSTVTPYDRCYADYDNQLCTMDAVQMHYMPKLNNIVAESSKSLKNSQQKNDTKISLDESAALCQQSTPNVTCGSDYVINCTPLLSSMNLTVAMETFLRGGNSPLTTSTPLYNRVRKSASSQDMNLKPTCLSNRLKRDSCSMHQLDLAPKHSPIDETAPPPPPQPKSMIELDYRKNEHPFESTDADKSKLHWLKDTIPKLASNLSSGANKHSCRYTPMLTGLSPPTPGDGSFEGTINDPSSWSSVDSPVPSDVYSSSSAMTTDANPCQPDIHSCHSTLSMSAAPCSHASIDQQQYISVPKYYVGGRGGGSADSVVEL